MTLNSFRPLLALDSDSVMTDYNGVVPSVWREAFGVDLQVARPNCYHSVNMFGMDLSDPVVARKYWDTFDARFWGDMPALPGAQEACAILVDKGYDLVCVTSMPKRYEDARAENFRKLGLPIRRVYAAERQGDEPNPKLETLKALAPVAFVDDLLSNFIGLDGSMHRAWLDGEFADDPNSAHVGQGLHDSRHRSLLEFAEGFRPAR